MRTFEEEGKTVEDAINKALTKYQVDRKEIDIQVLDQGSKGFLGLIGSRPAKVRITVKDVVVEKREKKGIAADKKEELNGQVIKIKEMLEGLLSKMGLNAAIDTETKDNEIMFNIKCDDDKLLIGKKGKTLDALEYLINLMIHKHASDKFQITLDTSNYRAQRQQSLKNLALKLSRKVKNTGKPAVMAPLSPHDRRVIHMALKNDPAIRTLSRGNGFFRRIVISKNSQ
jgi:spoIIIJ-associated protein